MIAEVIVFPNSMVMVFDSLGEQMPGYQQGLEAAKEAILRDALPLTNYWFAVWGKGQLPLTREEFRRLHIDPLPDEDET